MILMLLVSAATMDPGTVEALRYIYAGLAILAGTGFTATLLIRWDVLHPGERILRAGLVIEHAVITYGAYVAIDLGYPPTIVAALATASLTIICLGFAVWFCDLALHGDDGIRRLTDTR